MTANKPPPVTWRIAVRAVRRKMEDVVGLAAKVAVLLIAAVLLGVAPWIVLAALAFAFAVEVVWFRFTGRFL